MKDRPRRVSARALALFVCALAPCAAQDAASLASKIRATDELEARRALVVQLRQDASREAYAEAKSLWTSEKDPVLRAALLAHALRSPATRDEFALRILEKDKSPEARFAAAEWFVAKHGKDGLGLLQSLRSEDKTAQLERIVFAACASTPKSSAAGRWFAEQFPLLPPTRQLPVLELLRHRELRRTPDSRSFTALRSSLWKRAKWPPIRAEVLEQMAREGLPEAKSAARKLARKRVDPKLAKAVFVALTQPAELQDYELLGPLLALRGSGVAPLLRDFVTAEKGDPETAAWARSTGCSAKSAGTRKLALAFLEHDPSKAASEALFALAKDRDDAVRRGAVRLLAARGDTRVRALLDKWIAGGPLERRLDALEALATLRKDPGFESELLALAGDGPTDLRILAIRLAARRGAKSFAPLIPELLGHGDWRVVSAGIELARRVREASSVPLLIKLVARAKGRTLAETKQALKGLTRLFYERPADWTRWWARDGASFELPPAAPEDEVAKAPDTGPEGGDNARGGKADARNAGTTASFYGIPVESRRVAFCLDVSGSMGELAGTGISRLSIAKQSLIRALERMPKGTRVHVIFFDSEVHRYKKRLTSLDPKKMDKLVDFVRAQKPLGETNLWGAIDAALEDRNVDTIYVLSDGEPSVGEIVDVREFGDELLRLNRRRSVLFHCVAIGEDSALLRRLSTASGGRYVLQK